MNVRSVLLIIASVASAVPSMRAQGAANPAQTHTPRRAIHPPGKPTDSPVSYGMLVGDTLYISGRVGFDRNGKVPENLEDEIQNIFDDFKAVLTEANMTMDDLVYVDVSTSDLALYDKFNAAYRKWFTREPPARSFLGAGSVFRGGHFEVSGIAIRR